MGFCRALWGIYNWYILASCMKGSGEITVGGALRAMCGFVEGIL